MVITGPSRSDPLKCDEIQEEKIPRPHHIYSTGKIRKVHFPQQSSWPLGTFCGADRSQIGNSRNFLGATRKGRSSRLYRGPTSGPARRSEWRTARVGTARTRIGERSVQEEGRCREQQARTVSRSRCLVLVVDVHSSCHVRPFNCCACAQAAK